MSLVWFGTTLGALAWTYLLPLAGSPDITRGAVLALLGMVCTVVGLGAETPAGLASRARAGLRAGLAFAGVTLVLGLAMQPLRLQLFARLHRLPALSAAFAGLVSALGLPAASDPEGLIGVANAQHLLAFSINAEKLGLDVTMSTLISGAFLLAVARAGRGAWGRLVGATLGYAAVRFVTLVYIYANFHKPHEWQDMRATALFYAPDLIVLSFLPLPFVLARVLGRRTPATRLVHLRLIAPPAAAGGILLAAGVLCVVAGMQFVEPGVHKPGRILFDDYHSGRWEPSTAPVDTEHYGSNSVYTVTSLAEFLRLHYPKVEVVTDQPLTPALLSDVDVLVLKTMSRGLAPGEVDAVEAFVRGGGGLWLIADHTNLLGMGTFSNVLAERFGVHFRYDACNALSTGYFAEFHAPWLARHALTERVPWFRFLTSASLELGWSAEPVLVVPDLLSDAIDYSKPSFFGDMEPDPGDDFGPFVVAAAARLGRGRVLAFADSTVLSSFAIFMDGHVEFAMAVIDFLNRRNVLGRWPNGLLLVTGVVLLAVGGRRLLAGPPAPIVPHILAVLALGGAGMAGMRVLNRVLYRPPAAHTAYTTVGFLARGTAFQLEPAIARILVPPEQAFSTFYVAQQRLGLVPRVASRLRELEEAAAIVLVNPVVELSAGDLRWLSGYVETGHGLLIMIPDAEPGPAAQQLLAAFDLRPVPAPVTVPALSIDDAAYAEGVVRPDPAGSLRTRISGGTAVAVAEDLPIELVVRQHGGGRVVVVVGSTEFSLARLGHVMAEPDEAQRLRFRAAYFIVHDLLGLRGRGEATVLRTQRPSS